MSEGMWVNLKGVGGGTSCTGQDNGHRNGGGD